MKILFYQDPPSLNSTLLNWTLAEELRLLGHVVHVGKRPLSKKYDWIRSGGINSWDAIDLARSNNTRVHIHLEGVPYWRIGLEPAIKWGYPRNLETEEIRNYRRHYVAWMSAAYAADSCSVNGKNQVTAIEEGLFEGKKLPNRYIMSCGADARFALTLPDIEKENYMITVSRLEPNKKVFMIAEALILLKKKGYSVPPWVVVGYGTKAQNNKLIDICQQHDIKLRINPCFGAEKWILIKKSRLMLQGWSGIPPAEGLLCKTPVLSFDHPDIVEMYEDTIYWAKDNDIKDYADKIEWILDRIDIDKTKVLAGLDRLMNNELYACTQQQLAINYEKIFMGD